MTSEQSLKLFDLFVQANDLYDRFSSIFWTLEESDPKRERVLSLLVSLYKRQARRFEAFKALRMQEDSTCIFHQIPPIPTYSSSLAQDIGWDIDLDWFVRDALLGDSRFMVAVEYVSWTMPQSHADKRLFLEPVIFP